MDWETVRSKVEEDLLPEEKAYSIVRLDTMKPPDDPEFAIKYKEVDTLDDFDPKATNWFTWIAYDREGNGYSID